MIYVVIFHGYAPKELLLIINVMNAIIWFQIFFSIINGYQKYLFYRCKGL